MIKVLALLPLFLALLAACVELSPAGAQVKVLKDERAAELSTCQALGQVSVSSEDALRNAAATMSGDTALMAVREVGGSFYIRGSIYRCRQTAVVPLVIPPAPVSDTEAARKSTKCREKGGAWTGHQCVIEIE